MQINFYIIKKHTVPLSFFLKHILQKYLQDMKCQSNIFQLQSDHSELDSNVLSRDFADCFATCDPQVGSLFIVAIGITFCKYALSKDLIELFKKVLFRTFAILICVSIKSPARTFFKRCLRLLGQIYL